VLVSAVLSRLRRSGTITLLISPIGILIIAATRLLIVSNYNTVTASAILTSSGYVNTLLGSVLPVVQIYMPYVALALLFFGRFVPSMLAFLAAALISPTAFSRGKDGFLARGDIDSIFHWVDSHWWIYFFLLVAVISLLVELGLGVGVLLRSVGTVVSLAIALYVISVYPFPLTDSYYSSLLRQPWLPAEEVTLSSHQTIIGYTLSTGGVWMEVLRANDKTVRFYADNTVLSQQVCELEPSEVQLPLISLSHAVSRIPLCGQAPATASDPPGRGTNLAGQ
jgi:hypothetical protein